jgi:hypothetical protein
VYQKAIQELQEHCKQCNIGQAINLLMEFIPRPEEKPAEPTKRKEARPQPAKPDINRIEKACHKCKVIKPLSDYTLNKDCRDGHVGTCRTCEKARMAANYQRKQAKKQAVDPAKLHACKICGVRFSALNSLAEHEKLRHS